MFILYQCVVKTGTSFSREHDMETRYITLSRSLGETDRRRLNKLPLKIKKFNSLYSVSCHFVSIQIQLRLFILLVVFKLQ